MDITASASAVTPQPSLQRTAFEPLTPALRRVPSIETAAPPPETARTPFMRKGQTLDLRV